MIQRRDFLKGIAAGGAAVALPGGARAAIPGGAVHGKLDGLGSVPYGALVPVGFSNVLACGLCISVEEDYVKTIRMQPQCLTTGQVAGTAAALALDLTHGDTGSVPYTELKKRLEKQNHYFAG